MPDEPSPLDAETLLEVISEIGLSVDVAQGETTVIDRAPGELRAATKSVPLFVLVNPENDTHSSP